MNFRIALLLLSGALAAGCAAFQAKRIPRDNTLVVANEPAYLYRANANGDMIAIVDSLHGGDTLTSSLYLKGPLGEDNYFLIMRGSDSLWARSGPVMTAKDYAAMLVGSAVMVPMEQEAEIMARAKEFMMRNSERSQIETIGQTTLTPSAKIKGGRSFQVHRRVVGKEIRLTVSCLINGGDAMEMSQWEQMMRDYLRAGIKPK